MRTTSTRSTGTRRATSASTCWRGTTPRHTEPLPVAVPSGRARREPTLPTLPPSEVAEVAHWIKGGGIAAIPTDTVYGLACLATHADAVHALADLKGRDADQPIAVLFDSVIYLAAHLEDQSALDGVIAHWPGALTAIVRARDESTLVPPVVTEEGTIGVRKPDDQLARAVIRACGGLLAVTSANRHGQSPATSAEEVAITFGDDLLVMDGGPRFGGVASTVVDLTADPPKVLREGPISAETLGLELGDGAREADGSDSE